MLKIGFDAKRYFHNHTGLGNYSRDLVRILSTYYPKDELFLFDPSSKQTRFQNIPKGITEIQPTNIWRFVPKLWRTYGLNNLIEEYNINIYHGLSAELPHSAKKLDAKLIVTIHDLIFLKYPKLYPAIDRLFYYQKTKHALKVADKIVAISEQTKHDLIEHFSINPDKIVVVYQGCANEFKMEYSIEKKEAVSRKFDLPKRYILNVGTIEPRKNALSIIQCLKNVDCDLVLVGRKNQKYFQEIENFLTINHLKHRVHLLQGLSLTELSVVYQMAQVFVYPSHYEGFGIPIIEALFSKVPVITSQGGVFPEAGGPNSLYVDSNSTNQLSKAIERTLLENKLRTAMIETGFEYAQKFTDSAIANDMHKVYESVI